MDVSIIVQKNKAKAEESEGLYKAILQLKTFSEKTWTSTEDHTSKENSLSDINNDEIFILN